MADINEKLKSAIFDIDCETGGVSTFVSVLHVFHNCLSDFIDDMTEDKAIGAQMLLNNWDHLEDTLLVGITGIENSMKNIDVLTAQALKVSPEGFEPEEAGEADTDLVHP